MSGQNEVVLEKASIISFSEHVNTSRDVSCYSYSPHTALMRQGFVKAAVKITLENEGVDRILSFLILLAEVSVVFLAVIQRSDFGLPCRWIMPLLRRVQGCNFHPVFVHHSKSLKSRNTIYSYTIIIHMSGDDQPEILWFHLILYDYTPETTTNSTKHEAIFVGFLISTQSRLFNNNLNLKTTWNCGNLWLYLHSWIHLICLHCLCTYTQHMYITDPCTLTTQCFQLQKPQHHVCFPETLPLCCQNLQWKCRHIDKWSVFSVCVLSIYMSFPNLLSFELSGLTCNDHT